MSRKTHSYSPWTLDALSALGRQITAERRLLRWTQSSLSERAGISVRTLIAIEKGAATTSIGTVFEVASLLGIPLVGAAEGTSRRLIDDRLAILPARAREKRDDVDDNF
jgi:transcriptional regulator with XRE-family HTH domain